MADIDELLQEVESMKAEEMALDEAFNITREEPVQQEAPPRKQKKITYIIGVFSAAAFLVVMGIAMIISLFTPAGILNAAKVTPVILVFLGIEIGANTFFRKAKHFQLDYKSLILCGAMVLFTFLVSLISLATSTERNDRYYIETSIENEIGEEFFTYLGTNANIKSVDIDFEIENTDVGAYRNADDVKKSDNLAITVNFETSQKSVAAFAEDCHEILGQIAESDYLFKKIYFVADDNINHFTVDVDGMYQLDLTSAQIAKMTNYFGTYIEEDVTDIAE